MTLKTCNCPLLYITSHKKFRNIALNCSFRNAQDKWSLCNWILKNMDKPCNPPSKVFTKWSLHHWLFTINIQNPQFLSVVQSPFDNCHSPFSPTTFFERGVYRDYLTESAGVRYLRTSCWRFRNRTSEISLIQKQRERKYRTKHFPCVIVFIIYILRHSSFCQPFISNLSRILKCQNMPLHTVKWQRK